ncbi:MAG: oligosaccharide flippase family protein [Myxococcota bacterium]
MANDEVAQDRRDLRRGVMVNALGYLLKLAVPVMLVLVIRFYGKEAFGIFTFAQATLLFVVRVAMVGLDKALLWWIPQQERGRQLAGWRAVLIAVGTLSTLIALAIAIVGAPVMAQMGDTPEAEGPLRVMAFALVPMALLELLVASTMGLKRMEPNVLVKETVLPIAMVGTALLLVPLGWGAMGLAVAMNVAYVIACGVAWVWWRKLFRGVRDPLPTSPLPPQRMLRYAIPMWMSEMSNSFLQRVDTYAVAYLTDLETLGVYAAVTQIANTIRSIRRSFDPIVLVIAAEIGAAGAEERLRQGFSYATFLVTATQLPVLAFILAFAQWLMPLFGEGFDQGTNAVMILCAFWVINSAVSLAGIVISAYGYSTLTFVNVLLAILIQGAVLWVLVPPYGLEGAAFGVGIGYTILGLIQLVQMRWLTGSWNLTALVAWPMVFGLAGACAAAVAWVGVPDPGLLVWRVVVFVAFVVVYGAGMGWMWRRRKAFEPKPAPSPG